VNLSDIFRGKGQHLSWARLPNDRAWATGPGGDIVPAGQHLEIKADQAYFVVRMKEMYLETSRKLWRKLYPMLHGFVSSSLREENAVAGPSQLRELGESSSDRLLNLNFRLAGPTAYKGGDVRLLVGLYAVPGADAARALVDTVGTLASLGGIAIGPSLEIARAVKAGVERVVGLDEARLQLGVDYTFPAGQPLVTGQYVGVAAPAAEVAFDQLWLRDGRLLTGDDPVSASPFEAADYLVIAVEHVEAYTDWPALPGMADAQRRISTAMSQGTADEKRARVREVWPEFQQLVDESPYLTKPDRLRIAGNVLADLRARIDRADPFAPRIEHRGAGEPTAAAEFDLAGVEEHVDLADAKSRAFAEQALTRAGDPFGGAVV
jgi:hypothetical protein